MKIPDQQAATGKIVWIASYPKSGNTWARCLIANLTSGACDPDLGRLGKIVPYQVNYHWLEDTLDIDAGDLRETELERVRAAAYRNEAGSRRTCVKIHDRHSPVLFPADISAGTVCIVRDPRDVAQSFAHHLNLPLDPVIAGMANPLAKLSAFGPAPKPPMPQHLGHWSDHVASWLDGGPRPLLLLRYEDMWTDMAAQTRRLARFLGLPEDDAAISRAVQACQFDRLQHAESESGFGERPDGMARFFRQGEAAAWRRALTEVQAARIVADHGPMMARLGYA